MTDYLSLIVVVDSRAAIAGSLRLCRRLCRLFGKVAEELDCFRRFRCFQMLVLIRWRPSRLLRDR